MTDDETFAHQLRACVDRAAPTIDVDTEAVLPRARRLRARRLTATGVASLLTVGLVGGWAATAQPWTPTPAVLLPGSPPSSSPATGRPEPTASPGGARSVADGWPEADYWYVRSESSSVDGGQETSSAEEAWFGRDAPGIILRDDGSEDGPIAFGPRSWGYLLVDGEWGLIGWDELYALPDDPAKLEAILYDSVQDDRSVGTPDDKVLEMAVELVTASPAPPGLRDAVWSVMAGLPGAEVEKDASDSTGRSGQRLSYQPSEGAERELVYSLTSHRLLEAAERVGGYSWTKTFLEEGTSDGPPIEPTLEMAGCGRWENC